MQMFSSSLSVYFNYFWNMLNLFTFWAMQSNLQRNTALKHAIYSPLKQTFVIWSKYRSPSNWQQTE